MRKNYLRLLLIYCSALLFINNQVSAQIVISQVYGGGGNAGATYTHDFIELFNRGTSPVSISGWSLQYTSAAGTGNFGANSTLITELPAVTIQPGKYFLVQEASNAAVGAALPTPDLIDPTPIAMAAGAGKVALVNTTTPLGCNGSSTPCSPAAVATIVDLVGYGTTANYFEGTGPAPVPSATLSDLRIDNGCTDNNNNATDFITALPAPRNSASAANNCGTPVTKVSVAAGINAAEPATNGTFTITLTAAAPVGGIAVTYTLNGSATENTDYSDALAGTIVVAQGNTTATITLAPTDDPDFEGTETIGITLNTATSPYTIDVANAQINLLDNDAPPSASVTAGTNAAEPATNGTFNINLSAPAPLGGVAVSYTLTGSATLNTDYSDPLGGTITIAAGTTTGTITLNVNDDAFIEGTESIDITLDNATNGFIIGTSSAGITLADNENPPIVVNEVYGGGGNGGSVYRNDFIELYNNGNTPFVLTGWSVQYNSAAGTGNWQVTPLSGSIPAHGYYLVQQAAGGGGTADLPLPDATGSISMAAGSGKVALVNNSIALSGQNPSNASIVDKVAYGTVTGGGYEGSGPAPAASATFSIQRSPTGFDANNNSTDFVAALSTPKNSVTDIIPPTVISTNPVHNATGVSTAFLASLTFNELVERGTGTIILKKVSDGNAVLTLNVAGAEVNVSGASVSFIIQGLEFNTAYYVEISAGAFRDLASNDFAGFPGTGNWNFTTGGQPVGTVGTTYNFNTCSSGLPDGFTFFSAVGPQIWSCTSFGRDASNLPLGSAPNGLQINGFNETNIPNIDWLISPSFDLTGTVYPLLSFWSRTAFNGKPLQLKVSTDYTGGDPSLATWTDINGKFPAQTSNAWTLSADINLAAFKHSNVHFAFVYTSSDDDGARWTLDDISIINSLIPPPPSLTLSTTDIQFTYVSAGSTADKTFSFIGNDLTGDVSLNVTGDFLLSKNGTDFYSSLLYTQAEANDQSKTVYVRFAPAQNNQNFTGSISISSPTLSGTVNLTGTSIDPVTTLEVVNWNVEWFGSTLMNPPNDDLQEQNIKTIIQNINADVYALAEVVSEARLANIVSQMPGYAYVISNYGSHTNTTINPPGALAEAQKLAFIYKTSVLSNITTSALLSQGINSAADLSNPAYNYWASGRFPYMMSADVTLNCVTKNVKFILVHGKANTSPTNISYDRRKKGADTLHYLLTHQYASDNIIILGDYNDDLDQSITAGFTVTSWSAFTTDASNFTPVTLPLSLAGKKSTVSYNDVIDHVTVSDDLVPYYLNGTASILSDVSSLVNNYGSTTTDHYPVFSRYRFSNTTAPVVSSCTAQSTFCANNTNTYTIPAFVATDDCGDAISYSYVVTGATSRAGSSNDASGTFNVGTSTVTWTATDGWGNSIGCQTTVVVNSNPTVSIPDAFAIPSGVLPNTVYIGYSPASSITLSSVVSGGAPSYSYSWSNGSALASITVSPTTNTLYTLTVTDANGCTGTAGKTVNAIDIRGGNKLKQVILCHNGMTLLVGQNEVATHLSHGDMLGSCPVVTTTRPNTMHGNTAKNSWSVQALPNPSAGYFTLVISGDKVGEQMSMKVTDVLGRTIEQKQTLQFNQSLQVGAAYKPGLYFVEIIRGSEKLNLKLVKL